MLLQLTPHQQIKFLVRSAQLDVRFECYRIVALHQRVDEFVDSDRLIALVALGKVVPFQHPRHSVCGGQLDQVGSVESVHPCGIKHDLSFVRIQHFEYLGVVRLSIFQHLFTRQGWSRRIFTAGVTDHPRKIPDQEQCVMPEILQLAHLVEQHGMAEMQIRRSRIKARLDTQRSSQRQLMFQFFFKQQLVGTTLDLRKSIGRCHFCLYHASHINHPIKLQESLNTAH